MNKESFMRLYDSNEITFGDVVDLADYLDIEEFYKICDGESFNDYVDQEVVDMCRDMYWEEVLDTLNAIYSDIYDSRADYFNTDLAWGQMAISASSYRDIVVEFVECMDDYEYWDDEDFIYRMTELLGYSIDTPQELVQHDEPTETIEIDECIFI